MEKGFPGRQSEILAQIKEFRLKEYVVYFEIRILQSCGKRSAVLPKIHFS